MNGRPLGAKILKKRKPFLIIPMTKTMPTTKNDKAAVTARCDVVVNAQGFIPSRFAKRMKKKIVKTNGKNFMASGPVVSLTILAMNS